MGEMNAWLSVAVASGLALYVRGQSCQCKYGAATLPSSLWDGSDYENLTNVQVYGTTCAAWDSMPDTPYASSCDPSTSDFSGAENYCNVPWCYVESGCSTQISSSIWGSTVYYSYDVCGGTDCFTNPSALGCPWDPHGDGSYTQHNDSADCNCLYHGDVLPTAQYSSTEYATGYDAIQVYGTTCASWDSVPETPGESNCPAGSDWCHQDYNWCAIPWCYVDAACPTAIPSFVFDGSNVVFSFDTCGAPDCYSQAGDEADWPNLPAECPYDADYALSASCTAWTGVPATTTAPTNGATSTASTAARMQRLHAPVAVFAALWFVICFNQW